MRKILILTLLLVVATALYIPTRWNLGADEGWAIDMLGQVNAHRANAGLGPLVPCRNLNEMALVHTHDQARRGIISHTSSNGWHLGQRADAAEYGGRIIGENVAKGYGSVSAVMEGWLTSPGHRANILSSDFTHIGAARVDAGGVVYWTQNFGSKGICK